MSKNSVVEIKNRHTITDALKEMPKTGAQQLKQQLYRQSYQYL